MKAIQYRAPGSFADCSRVDSSMTVVMERFPCSPQDVFASSAMNWCRPQYMIDEEARLDMFSRSSIDVRSRTLQPDALSSVRSISRTASSNFGAGHLA
jgi:hypothetical protein